jgi:PIN domain nuclease of toxin-antitoxin system
MIVLDTHIWIWWASENPKLKAEYSELIRSMQIDGIGVSAISCWEVSMLHSKNRLHLDQPVLQWIENALSRPYTILLPLSPRIAVESNTLVSDDLTDPADRLIVATAKVYDCPLATFDNKIRRYSDVQLLDSP